MVFKRVLIYMAHAMQGRNANQWLNNTDNPWYVLINYSPSFQFALNINVSFICLSNIATNESVLVCFFSIKTRVSTSTQTYKLIFSGRLLTGWSVFMGYSVRGEHHHQFADVKSFVWDNAMKHQWREKERNCLVSAYQTWETSFCLLNPHTMIQMKICKD